MADQEWSFAHHFADSTDPRVARLDPDESQRCFLGRIGAPQRATDRRVIALDGKALRRSSDRAKGESPLHSAHAWATANHRLRGPVAGDEESDEITALAESLRMLGLSGAIVTIDALGCQEEIARPLREGGADDVLAPKGDHEQLRGPVVASREEAYRRGSRGYEALSYHRQWTEEHGRFEARRCWAPSDPSGLGGREEWAGLRSVVSVAGERLVGESLTVPGRSDLSGLPADAKLWNEVARGHWAVEDSLDWVLEVTCDEDRGRIRKGDAPEDFGVRRRLALCLLKRARSSKGSIKGKRERASWDEGYLLQVLCGNVGN